MALHRSRAAGRGRAAPGTARAVSPSLDAAGPFPRAVQSLVEDLERLAQGLIAQGRAGEAVDQLEDALRRMSTTPNLLFVYAAAARAASRSDLAHFVYQRVIRYPRAQNADPEGLQTAMEGRSELDGLLKHCTTTKPPKGIAGCPTISLRNAGIVSVRAWHWGLPSASPMRSRCCKRSMRPVQHRRRSVPSSASSTGRWDCWMSRSKMERSPCVLRFSVAMPSLSTGWVLVPASKRVVPSRGPFVFAHVVMC